MTYKETLDFLYSKLPAYHRIGKAAYKNDLNNTTALDEYFKHPHLKYKTIHVAGTNGKGSVSHMIASVLQEAGYKTGLYTSPHLKDFRERIRVNGEMISKKAVVSFVKLNEDIIVKLSPSFFELTVAMAFEYFAKCKVDIAVIEVGLGGRLDSTNIISPVLSVITNIGHDHMDLLGDTLKKVALEKAGIIKKNVAVVISESHGMTKDVFVARAKDLTAPISFADERFICKLEDYNNNGFRRYFITDLDKGKKFKGETILGGDYQSKNLQAVFAVRDALLSNLVISDKNLKDGIKNVVVNTSFLGRWQVLAKKPLTICDTGHNKEGLEYVLAQIGRIPRTGLHIILGFVSDKDIGSLLPLFPKDAVYYFTKASVPRALNELVLRSEAAKFDLKGESYPDVKTALKYAGSNAAKTDLIFIGGSTFIVGDVI